MAKVRMLNPYFEEEIKVKEDCKRISDVLGYIEQGNMDFLQLHQIKPEDRLITISPKNFAKIDYYDDKEE